MKKSRCMICGKPYDEIIPNNKIPGSRPHVDKDDCYIIYRKLEGIYGNAYIMVLREY